MFCTKCGSQVKDDQQFCTNCGAPLDQGASGPAEAPEPIAATSSAVAERSDAKAVQNTASKGTNRSAILTGVIAGVVIVAAIIAAIVILMPTDTGATTVSSPSSDSAELEDVTEESADSQTADDSEVDITKEFEGGRGDQNVQATIPGEFIGITGARASSTLPTGGINVSDFSPTCVIDGNTATCWCENAPGNGVGESITLWGPGPQAFNGFTISSGFQESQRMYERNARPKTIEVYVDGNHITTVTLADAGLVPQTFNFNDYGKVEGYEITFVIASVYPGSAHEDCCISEITVF